MLLMAVKKTVLLAFAAITCVVTSGPQMPAKAFSIIRNDSSSQVTFEYRGDGVWQKVTLDSQKDASIAGDRVRIGTNREDNATVTVERPVGGGKKYRIFWNDPPGMWDFKAAD